jgi:arachidonate 15-lipoxygenase
MLPSLPAQDPNPSERRARVDEARARLRYSWDQPPGIAMAEEVPRGEGYSPRMIAEVLKLTVATKLNRVAPRLPHPQAASRLASCRALFATIEAPPIAAVDPGGARADAAFAWQRVGGANPLVLEGVDCVPEHFPVSAETFAAAVHGDDTLDAARAEGRLYLADFRLLQGIAAGTGAGAQKYLAAPLALFVHRRGVGLAPAAIQCAQEPGPGAPILSPRDGVAWQMARAVVQVADCNLHELFFHLGRAHFLVEAFALASARTLAAAHPLSVLLGPHFEGTLAINDGARTKLCAPGGDLEKLLAPTLEGSLTLARRAIETFRLEDALLPADLRRRRVDDASRLADYPYRDDGRLVWEAIAAFVQGYVALYYPDDAAVASDTELLAWTAEIHGDDGGRVRGFPARIETATGLATALTWLIFTASAQHAALNYPQFDFMAHAPSMPAAGYAPAPERDPSLDAEAAWARMLPPEALAADQLDFFYQQSSVRENCLGRYPHHHFADPRARSLADRFAEQLASAEDVIAARNDHRFMPYPWLLPSNITASIHI